jgi:gliding motility-associated lipoprotein GldH
MYRPIAALACILFFAACGTNYEYHSTESIEDACWTYTDTINFDFTIEDTSAIYTLYVDFDHTADYPYQNVYTKLYTRFPNGKRLSRVTSFNLFNNQGESNGNCSGDACNVHLILQENAFFSDPGNYTITLEQNMRKDSIRGIKAIGLAIEKTGKKG